MRGHRSGGVFPLSTPRFASDEARKLLVRNQIADIEAVHARGRTQPFRHAGRCVWDTLLEDEQGSPVRVFVKMNCLRRRLWPRMTDLKTGQVLQSLPEREWRGLERLQSLGLNVPERLALFRDGVWLLRSAIIVREAPVRFSLHDLIHRGDWARLSPDQQDALFDEIAATMRTIQRAGLGWRGIGSGHLFPQLMEGGRWSVWLIDCEGVHRRTNGKTAERDFNKLQRSLRVSGADPSTLERLGQRFRRAA